MVAVLFGGGYFYYTAQAVCKVPIAYQVGEIDERFDLTHDEARTIVSNAESLWEDATGRNLFTYDEKADVVVTFIFDERQELSEEERHLRDQLDEKKDVSEAVRGQYEELRAEYDSLRSAYETKRADYEARLAEHNAEVDRWNEEGGAPEDVYAELTETQERLSQEQGELNRIAHELNRLVREINNLSEQGNVVVETYNSIVEAYNNRFSEEREFTQGDYTGDQINIYQYNSVEELTLVLAHEFGHALSLGHIDEEAAIMHHFMGEQDAAEGVTEADLAEFNRVCGEGSFTLWSIL